MRQNKATPTSVRKQPETFCCTLIIRKSLSARLLDVVPQLHSPTESGLLQDGASPMKLRAKKGLEMLAWQLLTIKNIFLPHSNSRCVYNYLTNRQKRS